MDGHDGGTPIGMAEIQVAAFLAKALKAKMLKEADELGRF